MDSIVDLSPLSSLLIEYLMPVLVSIFTALGSWVAWQIKKRTGLEIEQAHRDAFTAFATNQAGKFLSQFDTLKGIKIDVQNPMIAALANEAVRRVPDAVTFFGLTPDVIGEMIVAKIGVLTAATPDNDSPPVPA